MITEHHKRGLRPDMGWSAIKEDMRQTEHQYSQKLTVLSQVSEAEKVEIHWAEAAVIRTKL
jgi:hypothetical protein